MTEKWAMSECSLDPSTKLQGRKELITWSYMGPHWKCSLESPATIFRIFAAEEQARRNSGEIQSYIAGVQEGRSVVQRLLRHCTLPWERLWAKLKTGTTTLRFYSHKTWSGGRTRTTIYSGHAITTGIHGQIILFQSWGLCLDKVSDICLHQGKPKAAHLPIAYDWSAGWVINA